MQVADLEGGEFGAQGFQFELAVGKLDAEAVDISLLAGQFAFFGGLDAGEGGDGGSLGLWGS